jgi:hypothetical protein
MKMGRAATILNSCPKQGRKGLFFYFFSRATHAALGGDKAPERGYRNQ